MMKLLDYYYLVLARWFVKIEYHAFSVMALIFSVNLLTLTILLFGIDALDNYYVWIIIGVLGLIIDILLSIIYNNKRHARIVEKYKKETQKEYVRGTTYVVLYMLGSVAALILTFAIFGKPPVT